MWRDIDHACEAAKFCGYKFFSWNGWVYNTDGIRQTITTESLDQMYESKK